MHILWGEYKYLNKHLKTCKLKRIENQNISENNISINSNINDYSKLQLNKEICYYPDLIIGSGSTTTVYYGKNIQKDIDLAIKMETLQKGEIPNSFFEDFITKQMSNIEGFAINYGYFKINNKEIILQTLFGPSLRRLFNFCDRKFTLRTICIIFIESLKRLKDLHTSGFLHNDINMQNFSWGKFVSGKLIGKNTINLIDFGASSKYIYPLYDEKNNSNNIIGYKTYPKEKLNYIDGTLEYLDRSVLDGYRPSRKTDIISLVYLIIEMFKGELPWSLLSSKKFSEKVKEIKRIHKNTKVIDLFNNIPCEFYTIYNELQKLMHGDKPDYLKYENLVMNLFLKNGGKVGEKFCWEPEIEKIFSNIKNKLASNEEVQKIHNLFKGFPL